tara:strand:- start:170 stop:505 length:336 start_codon:yes stop_codon:yes gene_type:complete
MKERKSAPLGDMSVATTKDENGNWVDDLYQVYKDGKPTEEYTQKYQIRVYIPDDVDEAGIGEPSIVLKRDQFINARALSQEEENNLPDFLKGRVPCKLSVQMNRKQYPKKK